MTTNRRSPTSRKTQIVRMLKTRPRTAEELAAATGMRSATVRRYLADLHGKRIHVVAWLLAESGRAGRFAALWASGPGADAPRPPQGHYSDVKGDMDETAYISASRRRAIAHAERLAKELSKLPAGNPLQALVAATLYAENRETQVCQR